MKRIIFIITTILLVAGCSSKSWSFKEISYNELSQKIKDKETFVILIESSTCSHCESYEPKLQEVLSDYGIDIYYIDMNKVTESQYNSVKNKVGLEGTPTLIYIENGKSDIAGSLVGDSSKENTIDFFKEIGYISGE